MSAFGNASRTIASTSAADGLNAPMLYTVRVSRSRGASASRSSAVHRVGHRHERDARVRADEAGVRLALRRGVDHLRREVAGAARRQSSRPRSGRGSGSSGNRPCRSADRARVACSAWRSSRPSVLAVELVAAVHRRRMVEIVFRTLPAASSSPGRAGRRRRSTTDRGTRPAGRATRPAAGRTRARQRAFDVDVVRRHRRELAARREQRGEVEDAIDLVFGEDAVEQRACRGSSRRTAGERGRRRSRSSGLRSSVMTARSSRRARSVDEAVADFAAGAGDEDDGFAEHANFPRLVPKRWD